MRHRLAIVLTAIGAIALPIVMAATVLYASDAAIGDAGEPLAPYFGTTAPVKTQTAAHRRHSNDQNGGATTGGGDDHGGSTGSGGSSGGSDSSGSGSSDGSGSGSSSGSGGGSSQGGGDDGSGGGHGGGDD